jgi:hypothetical protein
MELLPCIAHQILGEAPFNHNIRRCIHRICEVCNERNQKNFMMIKEAVNLGVCGPCRKRETPPVKNRNNTLSYVEAGKPSWDCICRPYPNPDDGAICATHIETYARLVKQRSDKCILYRRQIMYSPAAKSRNLHAKKNQEDETCGNVL